MNNKMMRSTRDIEDFIRSKRDQQKSKLHLLAVFKNVEEWKPGHVRIKPPIVQASKLLGLLVIYRGFADVTLEKRFMGRRVKAFNPIEEEGYRGFNLIDSPITIDRYTDVDLVLEGKYDRLGIEAIFDV